MRLPAALRYAFFASALLTLGACTSVETRQSAGIDAPVEPAATAHADTIKTDPPSLLFPGLFETVAAAELFPTKDWVDAVPAMAPGEIMSDWYDLSPETLSDFQGTAPVTRRDIRVFVDRHFDLPDTAAATIEADSGQTMRAHIEALWPELTHDTMTPGEWSSLITLPEPYIVPGGRFREVYYWDAYFTMEGMGEDHAGLKRAMVDNFASLIETYGFIPNANRTYYLSRSQPPFFFRMVGLLSPEDPAQAYADYLQALKAEHAFWMRGAMGLSPGGARERVVNLGDGAVLNRYWDDRKVPRDESYNDDVATARASSRPDPIDYRNLRAGAESGWDFSSRWFEADQLASIETTFIIPADLNAILYGLEEAIAAGCTRTRDVACAEDYALRAANRAKAMRDHLWNDDLGAYDDYDFVESALKGNVSAAALYPLFFGVASETEAGRTAAMVEAQLLAPGGLLSTNRETGQQWDAPNGWAPLHWIAVNGLADYGHETLARDIAQRWLATASRTYCETGKMVEKYNVAEAKPGGGGEYPTQDGFGWTNGVTIALMEKYDALRPYGDITPVTGPEALQACTRAVMAAAPR